MITQRESLIKRLRYRSANRGCKELDLIIANFANQHLDNMTNAELLDYEQMLNLEDSYIYQCIVDFTSNLASNKIYDNPMLQKLLNSISRIP